MTEYQVVGECCHVEVWQLGGTKSLQMLYKGAPVPDGVPAERIAHLLRNGLIAEVGEVPVAPNASVPQDPARGLDSVTTEVLTGEPAPDPGLNPAEVANERVAETVTEQGRIDKAAEAPEADREVEARRAAARQKLPEGGRAPDGRAGQDVWAEYLVARGSDYDDVKDLSKAELRELADLQS